LVKLVAAKHEIFYIPEWFLGNPYTYITL